MILLYRHINIRDYCKPETKNYTAITLDMGRCSELSRPPNSKEEKYIQIEAKYIIITSMQKSFVWFIDYFLCDYQNLINVHKSKKYIKLRMPPRIITVW